MTDKEKNISKFKPMNEGFSPKASHLNQPTSAHVVSQNTFSAKSPLLAKPTVVSTKPAVQPTSSSKKD